MSWLGKIGASLFSASNENTLALSNLKFDFALLKVEAPQEFSALGSALCNRRKIDAEDGTPHRTARKLGALFEHRVPSTPKLIAAYGQRVSEIINAPGINPEGLKSHGPFKTYVGADATALWAAATSGISAIAMYLLASLLAHEWDHKEAVSIWVELVAERKREIMDNARDCHMVSESSLFSSRQDISRDELALWDTSARSWLRSASKAKARQLDQFLLISKNLPLQYSSGTGTYEKVLNYCREAMQGMENLLSGRPQLVMDRAIPTAILAWHLFPDLVVLSKEVTNVVFGDKLIPKSGTCTIGSVSYSDGRSGSHWSLTLSHYQFYGPPVKVDSQEHLSRVDFRQLLVITFGSLLGAWQIRRIEIMPAVRWFLTLSQVLTGRLSKHKEQLGCSGLDWLDCFIEAAKIVDESGGLDDQRIVQLLHFGMRRAKHFLCGNPQQILPFFGLCNPYVFAGLDEVSERERPIRFFREIAKELKLDNSKSLIVVAHHHGSVDQGPHRLRYWEYASVKPFIHSTNKRSVDGEAKTSETYVRWISGDIADREDHQHIAEIQRRGEEVLKTLHEHPTQKYLAELHKEEWTKERPEHFQCLVGNNYLGLWVVNEVMATLPLTSLYCSFMQSLMLKVVMPLPSSPLDLHVLEPARLYDYLHTAASFGNRRATSTQSNFEAQHARGISFLARHCGIPNSFVRSLHGLSMASQVYSNLYDASISLKLVTSGSSLADAQWIPSARSSDEHQSSFGMVGRDGNHSQTLASHEIIEPLPTALSLTRQQTFACLAHFESGEIDLDPESLDLALALSTENSIYVAGVVMADPYECVPENRVERLTGNIGRSGISILIAPQNPEVRELKDCYNIVEHKQYDLQRENNFKATSLHLNFTEWKLPLEDTGSRTIDQDVYFVESVISVRDRGEWVADLDILSIDFDNLTRIAPESCNAPDHQKSEYEYQCLDSWEEFLDPPDSVKIFRAHGNWAARLAAVSILTQRGNTHNIALLGRDNFCLTCLENDFNALRIGLRDSESPLPAFCID
ncbi:hypothetical protein MMC10_007576 [Thelotrema lepadinum]|nr:hypothetical protein [Thelotrema lepadinum]